MTVVKQGICFLAGAMLGAAIVLTGLYFYPFPHASRTDRVFPAFMKSSSHTERFRLLLSAAADKDVISISTSGRPAIFPNMPPTIKPLSDPNVRDGLALITEIRDEQNTIIGFATELESGHEDSRLLTGRVMTHTTWTLVIPGRGALFLYQTEDNWILLKRFILPALLFGKSWAGSWINLNTLGPSPEGYGLIIAGTGDFAQKSGHFVEYAELTRFTPVKEFSGVMDLYVAFAN